MKNTAILFPAFIFKYSVSDLTILKKYSNKFDEYLENAKKILNINFKIYSDNDDNLILNEFESQIFVYIYSCILSNYFKTVKIKPLLVSSYSMGLYAALNYIESINFGDGLLLIERVYNLALEYLNNTNYAMAGIIGLKYIDIENIIINNILNIEIINCNGIHSFVVSGDNKDIEILIEHCKQEGALNSKILPVSIPYHTKYMKKIIPSLKNFISDKIKINLPNYPYFSSISQKEINSTEEIKYEIINNIINKMDWFKTMNFMVNKNIDTFIECGPGKSLYKIGKFIEGNFQIYPIKKYRNIKYFSYYDNL